MKNAITVVVSLLLLLGQVSQATAEVPSAQVIQQMSRAELKAFLEHLELDDLKLALESVDLPTLKVGLEIVDASTLRNCLEVINEPTLENALINIDRRTLRNGVRLINRETLENGLNTIDGATLEIALESMDRQTLKNGMEVLNNDKLKTALTDSSHKIDEPTFVNAWNIVDVATKNAMENYRVPESLQSDSAKDRLQERLGNRLSIGNQGRTEITEYDYDPQTKRLRFKANVIAKHDYGQFLPTIQATFHISCDVDCANPADSECCVSYNNVFTKISGRSKDCFTGKELAAVVLGG